MLEIQSLIGLFLVVLDQPRNPPFDLRKIRGLTSVSLVVELTKVANVHGYSIDANGNKIDSSSTSSVIWYSKDNS